MDVSKKLKIIINNVERLSEMEGEQALAFQKEVLNDISYVSSRIKDEEDIDTINYVYDKLPQLTNKKGKEATRKLLNLKEKLAMVMDKQKFYEQY